MVYISCNDTFIPIYVYAFDWDMSRIMRHITDDWPLLNDRYYFMSMMSNVSVELGNGVKCM